VLVVGLAAWGYLDVTPRGRVVAGRPELHQTDVTVFTGAGAAFFDGRDPYAVTNPRGWSYLYPPLFALSVAPLSRLDPVWQVAVWYAVSVALGFGVFVESCRLWRLLGGGVDRLGVWVGMSAGLAVLLPLLECLQRGQVGIALLYALMLGCRLVLEGRSRGVWGGLLGGVVLAWPVAVKLIPALPVGFLLWQRGALALAPDRPRGEHETGRAAALGAGLAAGLALFLLLIPAACLGWGANLGHLRAWTRKVVTNPDAGGAAKFHVDSTTNQSFPNAAYRLASVVRPRGPDDPALILLSFARTPEERRWALDRAEALRRQSDVATRRLVRVVQAVLAALLLVLGSTPRRDDLAGQAAGFGLACLAMLVFSPVAWTHYYPVLTPALLAVPLWLDRRGHPGWARASAAAPAVLVWSHYLAKPWVGPLGLLGLGTTAWILAVTVALLAGRWHDPGRSSPSAPHFRRPRRRAREAEPC
jgi:hypothetical protein